MIFGPRFHVRLAACSLDLGNASPIASLWENLNLSPGPRNRGGDWGTKQSEEGELAQDSKEGSQRQGLAEEDLNCIN